MNRNLFLDFLFDNMKHIFMGVLLLTLLGGWFITSYLPKERAKNFFSNLEKKPGFTKLVDLRDNSKTKEFFNIGGALDEALNTQVDKINGYTFSQSYTDGDTKIEAFDEVDILSPDGKHIASGQYEGYWSNNNFGLKETQPTDGYHIICIYTPGTTDYDKEFKIKSDSVILHKK